MRWNLVIPVVLCFFPVAAYGAEDGSKNPGDVFVFLNALALSYNNYHPEARAQFERYQKIHPDDLLSRLRIMYDHTAEVHFKEMDEAMYVELLGEANEAIIVFETKGCSGTDLVGIAENTLDCDYIAAALYVFRAALRANHEGLRGKYRIRDALRADDTKFFDHAKRSKSKQAQFLLGVHEYELSNTLFGMATGRPHNGHDGLMVIKNCMDDASPFTDDIWFYVLRQETENPGDTRRIFADTPPATIIARLKSKYPNHKYPTIQK